MIPEFAERDVFIARHNRVTGNMRSAALLDGSFLLAEDCLLFRVGDQTVLPVFPSTSEVTVTGKGVSFDARTLTYDETMRFSGGITDPAPGDLLASPPAACDYPRVFLG